MEIGPLEIILIVVIAIAAALIMRIVRMGRASGVKNDPTTSPKTAVRQSNGGRSALNGAGVVLVIAGILGLMVAASLFRLILQGYLWALLAIASGFILLRLSRKSR